MRAPLSPTRLALAAALIALAPSPAGADPGPGTVLSMAPPDARGGPLQVSGLVGTPHRFEDRVHPLMIGLTVEDRIAPWMFITLAFEADPYPGSDRFHAANAIGPTFLAGRPRTNGFLVVLAPRAGVDGHRKGAWAWHLGFHALADVPLALGGALRGFVGPRYTLREEFQPRSEDGAARGVTHYLGATAGITAHLLPRLDLSGVFTIALVRADRVEPDGECCSPLEPTGSLRITLHVGPLPAERAVAPAPGARGAAADD